MDGAHDLGGRQGFGPIETEAPPWRHDWEHRQWALTRLLPARAAGIDAWRHGVEQIPHMAYLSLPYFGKWNLNDTALLIQSGHVTQAEVISGQTHSPGPAPEAKTVDQCLEMVRQSNQSFARPIETPPAFAPGDRVTTQSRGHIGHTRLPAYARAATGTVTAHHGAHVYPDTGAEGHDEGHHLYTVEFAARDLFPEAHGADSVLLDLWEPYLTGA